MHPYLVMVLLPLCHELPGRFGRARCQEVPNAGGRGELVDATRFSELSFNGETFGMPGIRGRACRGGGTKEGGVGDEGLRRRRGWWGEPRVVDALPAGWFRADRGARARLGRGGGDHRSAGVVRQQGGSETAAKLGRPPGSCTCRSGKSQDWTRASGDRILHRRRDGGGERGFWWLVDVRREAGVENEWVEPEEGKGVPGSGLGPFCGGHTYTADDGTSTPPVAARNATCAVLSEEAVDLFEMCEVLGIDRAWRSLRCGEWAWALRGGEGVVDAGGPRGAREFGAMAGVEVPVMAVRHQIVSFPYVLEGLPNTRFRWCSTWARGTTGGPRSRVPCSA